MADVRVMNAEALEALADMPDASVDAVVTDPPYELGFMGKGWDASGIAYSVDLWRECLRVLKSGGHLLAFGGTRTVHRLTCAIEDAGFEIRDGIDWLYGNGFPKSLDVSKAIDKAAGATREVIGPNSSRHGGGIGADVGVVATPATDDAVRWSGWGTALKPAREPIVVARKPFAGTVAANVLAYGTGALNIDVCRVPGRAQSFGNGTRRTAGIMGGSVPRGAWEPTAAGRWPSNVVLSHAPDCGERCVPGCSVAELDAQSGATVSRVGKPRGAASGEGWGMTATGAEYTDSGGASRFFPVFRYQAKAPTKERPKVNGIAHPTVKPLALMRWLVRLVTPPNGTVLDPFAGSGTTAEACLLEGFDCIAIEREASYIPLIEARIERQSGEKK